MALQINAQNVFVVIYYKITNVLHVLKFSKIVKYIKFYYQIIYILLYIGNKCDDLFTKCLECDSVS